MIQDEAPKAYGIETIDKKLPSTLQKVLLTQHSYATRLLCVELMLILVVGGLAILFGFMITNPGTERLSNRIQNTIDSGDSVIIWPTNITEKDINDMILAGHEVMSMLKSNTYHGLEAKIKFNNWKKI